GEHLQGGVTEDIPAQSDARRPLVPLFHVGNAVGVEVLEVLVAQAQRKQPVVGDLPAVLEVVGVLFDGERAAICVLVLRHVVAVPARAGGAATAVDPVAFAAGAAAAVDPAIAGAGCHLAGP